MALKWGYDGHNGPDRWNKYLKVTRKPVLGQSPIDIETENTHPANYRRLRFRYKRDRCVGLSNNGHTFVIHLAPNIDGADIRDFSLRRGPLKDDRFALAKIKFHWGRHNDEGSEHTVNGRQYAAEAHMVHYNLKYSCYKEAKEQRDGLAIVAVFFEIGPPNKGIDSILDLFEPIRYKGSRVDIGVPFYPKWLIPRVLHRQKFWHYHGSLTGPPCTEVVDWIVFMKPMFLGEGQLNAFRLLCKHCGTCGKAQPGDEFEGRIGHNFRPIQARAFHRIREEDNEEEDFDRPVWSFIRRRRRRRYVKIEGDSESSSSSSSSSDSSDSEDSNEEDSE